MQKKTLNLYIVSPMLSEDHVIVWIEVATPTGSFVVGPGHSPLISMLKLNSIVTFKLEDGKEHQKEIPGGVLTVADNAIHLIIS